jgi:hypothetical protein
MNRKTLLVPVCIAGGVIAAVVGTLAFAEPPKETKSGEGQPDFPLPPGWTKEDMQACMIAGTPGEMHEFLAGSAGVWEGKSTMWMYPGAEPIATTSTATITKIMDGRFTRCEISGEMPGMGPFAGQGTYGYDNATQKFVANWIDNHGTGMWNGTGELSPDKKTLTWSYTYNCPVTRKPATVREVERFAGASAKTLEMFGKDPKTGKEFKMMTIEFRKKS